MSHTLETVYEIWDDKHETVIEVGCDRRGHGLVEIRSGVDASYRVTERLVMNKEQAKLVAEALALVVDDQCEDKLDV